MATAGRRGDELKLGTAVGDPLDWLDLVRSTGAQLMKQLAAAEREAQHGAAPTRDTMNAIKFDAVDASDAMKNFVHRMKFRKGKGFDIVERLRPGDFAGTNAAKPGGAA